MDKVIHYKNDPLFPTPKFPSSQKSRIKSSNLHPAAAVWAVGLPTAALQHCSCSSDDLLPSFRCSPPPAQPSPAQPSKPNPASWRELHTGPWIIPACSSQGAPLQHCSSPAAPTYWCQLYNLYIGAMELTPSYGPPPKYSLKHNPRPPPPPPAVPRSTAPSDVQMMK